MVKKVTYDLDKYIKDNTEETCTGCLISTKALSRGRAQTSITDYIAIGKTKMLHRIVYIYYKGAIPEGLVVMHSCDNPACINIEHLSLGTQWDNMQDMVKKGRQGNRGANNPKSKLTLDKVEFIRRTVGIFSGNLIAKVFNLDRSTINLVRRNQTWKKL